MASVAVRYGISSFASKALKDVLYSGSRRLFPLGVRIRTIDGLTQDHSNF